MNVSKAYGNDLPKATPYVHYICSIKFSVIIIHFFVFYFKFFGVKISL